MGCPQQGKGSSLNLIQNKINKSAYEFVRRYVFGLWLLIVVFDPISLLSKLPVSIYNPSGIVLKALPKIWTLFLIQEQALIALKMGMVVFLLYRD